jgi:hypothetical protein
VILAFYPADWSPVCGDQMTLYNHVLPEFRRHGAELLGISVNGTPAFFVNGVRYDSPFGVNGLAAAIDRAVLTAA